MYLWELTGHDAAGDWRRSGVGDELGPIMRAIETDLAKLPGCVGRVTEVVQRMSVSHLDTVHVPTGREWLGRCDPDGAACWEARHHPADPDAASDLAASPGMPAAG